MFQNSARKRKTRNAERTGQKEKKSEREREEKERNNYICAHKLFVNVFENSRFKYNIKTKRESQTCVSRIGAFYCTETSGSHRIAKNLDANGPTHTHGSNRVQAKVPRIRLATPVRTCTRLLSVASNATHLSVRSGNTRVFASVSSECRSGM